MKEGISDGFLAPYKVIKVTIDKDVEGYVPKYTQTQDDNGEDLEYREYNIKDFDRTLVLDDRTKLVAKRVSQYWKETDKFAKNY